MDSTPDFGSDVRVSISGLGITLFLLLLDLDLNGK